MAGVVKSAGKGVTRFKVGDAVFGETIGNMQWINGGTLAEHVAVSEDNLAHKPDNATFEQAACVPTAGYIALLNLRDANPVVPGQRVLVNGAGGGVGSLALQILKYQGAHVTAVDNTQKLNLLRALGADAVIDYTKEKFILSGGHYDLVFDIPGNYHFSAILPVLNPDGKYILIAHDNFGKSGHRWFGAIPYAMKLMFMSLIIKKLPRPVFSMPGKRETMGVLKDLLKSGKINPVIDSAYPLSETARALRHLIKGNPQGRIVITP